MPNSGSSSANAAARCSRRTVYSGTTNINDYTTRQPGCSYYANAQPHALRQYTQGTGVGSSCYDQNGNLVSETWRGAPTSTLTWTSYNQPNLITSGWPTINTGTSSSQFFYDHNHQRWKQIASYSGTPETTLYIGGLLEKMTSSGGTYYRHYVPAGNNFVIYTDSPAMTKPAIYYVTEDHLGSAAVITDQTGTLVADEKFSAGGINETSAQQATAAATVTRHAYTGQESLGNVFLVNMNGRLYAPSPMYFLSPDPHIPNSTDTRSYNRYAYVRHNPLTFIDPTGFTDTTPSCRGNRGRSTSQISAVTLLAPTAAAQRDRCASGACSCFNSCTSHACVFCTLERTSSVPRRIRNGSVLMNIPSTRSAPSPPCIRPNITVPNTTSSRPVVRDNTNPQARCVRVATLTALGSRAGPNTLIQRRNDFVLGFDDPPPIAPNIQ